MYHLVKISGNYFYLQVFATLVLVTAEVKSLRKNYEANAATTA